MNRLLLTLICCLVAGAARAQTPVLYLPFRDDPATDRNESPGGVLTAWTPTGWSAPIQYDPLAPPTGPGPRRSIQAALIKYLYRWDRVSPTPAPTGGTLSFWLRPEWATEGPNTWTGAPDAPRPAHDILSLTGLLTVKEQVGTLSVALAGATMKAPTTGWTLSDWHPLVIRWAADSSWLSVDGRTVAAAKLAQTPPVWTTLVVGRSDLREAESVNGWLADLAIWDTPQPSPAALREPWPGPAPTRWWDQTPSRLVIPAPPVLWQVSDTAVVQRAPGRERWRISGTWALAAAPPPDQAPNRWPLRTPVPAIFWLKDRFPIRDSLGRPTAQPSPAVWIGQAVTSPPSWRSGRRVRLVVDRLVLGQTTDWEVFVNGRRIGRVLSSSGVLDMTDAWRFGGVNTLAVRLSAAWGADGPMTDLWLEGLEPDAGAEITRLLPDPHPESDSLGAYLWTADGRLPTGPATLVVADSMGRETTLPVARQTVEVGGRLHVVARWPNGRRWTPETPVGYTMRVAFGRTGSYPVRFGYRSIGISGRDLTLNGAPLRLRGLSSEISRFGDIPFQFDRAGQTAYWQAYGQAGINAIRIARQGFDLDPTLTVADGLGRFVLSPGFDVRGAYKLWGDERLRGRLGPWIGARVGNLVGRLGAHPSLVMWSSDFNLGQNRYRLDRHYDRLGDDRYPDGDRDYALKRAAMATEDSVFAALDPTRPNLHHAAGAAGPVYSTLAYQSFAVPLQERADWPERWATSAAPRKPLIALEYAFPLLFFWHNVWAGPTAEGGGYEGEPLAVEWAAAYLGSRAYDGLTAKTVQLMTVRRKGAARESVGSTPAADILRGRFIRRTLRGWRGYGANQLIHGEPILAGGFGAAPPPSDLDPTGWQPTEPPLKAPPPARLSETGRQIAADNRPLLTFLGGWPVHTDETAHARAGQPFRKSWVTVNDAAQPVRLAASWTFTLGGRTIASADTTVQFGPGERRMVPLTVRVPDVATKQTGFWRLVVTKPDDPQRAVVGGDTLSVVVYPAPMPVTPGTRRIVLLDAPDGSTGRLLAALSVHPTPFGEAGPLRSSDVLIVGERTWTPATVSSLRSRGVEAAVRSGLRVLVLAQPVDSLLGLRLRRRYTRQVFTIQSVDPRLGGLSDDDLHDWAGETKLVAAYPDPGPTLVWGRTLRPFHGTNRGIVAGYVAEKPQAGPWSPLLDSGFDLTESPLLTARVGEGSWTICTLDLAERPTEPATAAVLRALLTAAIAPLPSQPTRFVRLPGVADGPWAALVARSGAALSDASRPGRGDGWIAAAGAAPNGGVGVVLGGGATADTLWSPPARTDVPGISTADLFFKRGVPVGASGWLHRTGSVTTLGLTDPAPLLDPTGRTAAKLQRIVTQLLIGAGARFTLAPALDASTAPFYPSANLNLDPYFDRRY